MAGKYCATASDGTLYYHIPIQVWRGLLTRGGEVFDDIFALFCSDCKNLKERDDLYRMSGGDYSDSLERWNNSVKSRITSEAYLSTTGPTFWKYVALVRENGLTPYVKRELHLWLCYMAINSIGGRERIKVCTNYNVLLRAAGYVSPDDYATHGTFPSGRNTDNPIAKLYHLPLTREELPKGKNWDKYNNRVRAVMIRKRYDIMEKWNMMHLYSEVGSNGFLCINDGTERQEAFNEMASYTATKKAANATKKAELKAMMQTAKENAKNRQIT